MTVTNQAAGSLPAIRQVSIFLENRAGRLADVTANLAAARINIGALSMADTSDFGILRLVVDDSEKACSVLRGQGFTVTTNRVVAVEVPDIAGGLNTVLETVSSSSINIEYMYPYVRQAGQTAVLLFRFDKVDAAIELLLAKGAKIISEGDLCK